MKDLSALYRAFAAPLRQRSQWDYPFAHGLKPAAVMMLWVAEPTPSVLLTVRASHLAHHPGQVAFAGGRQEPSDTGPVAAALRETTEEIGIPCHQIDIWGTMPTFRTISGYRITPVIGSVATLKTLNLDPDEVASSFLLPLHKVVDLNAYYIHWLTRSAGGPVPKPQPVFFLPHEGYNIWGATAAMLYHFACHVQKVAPPLTG